MTILLLLYVYTERVIDVFYIFNSTVIDGTCYIFFLFLLALQSLFHFFLFLEASRLKTYLLFCV